MSLPTLIQVDELTHRFGKREVLSGVSFQIGTGNVLGLIGPNGAGKTTLLRILAASLAPSQGQVLIDGHDLSVDWESARRVTGTMFDRPALYPKLTVWENLTFFSAAQSAANPLALPELLEQIGLTELATTPARTLSKGQRQRLEFGRALLKSPRVLLLDEPMSDLDPKGRIAMRDQLLRMASQGTAIIISSHILTELCELCSEVLILERGRVHYHGPVGGQLPTATESPRRTLARSRFGVLGELPEVVRILRGDARVMGVETNAKGELLVTHEDDQHVVAGLVALLVENRFGVVTVGPEHNRLESLVLAQDREVSR